MTWDSAAEQLLAFGAAIRLKRGAPRCRWPRESRNKEEARPRRARRNRAVPEHKGRALLRVAGHRCATRSAATSSRPSARWPSPPPSTSVWNRSAACSRTSRGSRSRSAAVRSSGWPRPWPACTRARISSTSPVSCAISLWRSRSLPPRRRGAALRRRPLRAKAPRLPFPSRRLVKRRMARRPPRRRPLPLPRGARRRRRSKPLRLPPKLLPRRPRPRRQHRQLRLLRSRPLPSAVPPKVPALPLPASSYVRECSPPFRNSPGRS